MLGGLAGGSLKEDPSKVAAGRLHNTPAVLLNQEKTRSASTYTMTSILTAVRVM